MVKFQLTHKTFSQYLYHAFYGRKSDIILDSPSLVIDLKFSEITETTFAAHFSIFNRNINKYEFWASDFKFKDYNVFIQDQRLIKLNKILNL